MNESGFELYTHGSFPTRWSASEFNGCQGSALLVEGTEGGSVFEANEAVLGQSVNIPLISRLP